MLVIKDLKKNNIGIELKISHLLGKKVTAN